MNTDAPETLEQTLTDRGAKYGDWMDQGEVSDAIISAMERGASWAAMPGWMRQAYRMVAEKMARAVTGDPLYADNLHDIAGYATIAEVRLHRFVAMQDQMPLPGFDPVMPEVRALVPEGVDMATTLGHGDLHYGH